MDFNAYQKALSVQSRGLSARLHPRSTNNASCASVSAWLMTISMRCY